MIGNIRVKKEFNIKNFKNAVHGNDMENTATERENLDEKTLYKQDKDNCAIFKSEQTGTGLNNREMMIPKSLPTHTNEGHNIIAVQEGAIEKKSKIESSLHFCKFCSYTTIEKYTLEWHVKNRHSEEMPFPCHLCQFRTSQSGSLKLHIRRIHPDEKMYFCPYCNFETYQTASFNSHIEENHAEKKHEIGPSKPDFDYRITMRQLIAISGNKDKVFACKICGFDTRRIESLRTHISRKHIKSNVLTCTFCDYSTSKLDDLIDHDVTKHGKITNPKMLDCEHCTYKTGLKSNLYRHTKKMHSNNSYDAKSSFKKIRALQVIRLEDIHPASNVPNTDSVDRLFYARDKNQIFVCQVCGFNASRQGTLESHVKFKHNDANNVGNHHQGTNIAKSLVQVNNPI